MTTLKDLADQIATTPAVETPDNAFEQAVNQWSDTAAKIAAIKAELKIMEAAERKMRQGITNSLVAFFGDDLKEGVNNYELSNGRTLKFTHKVTRTLDADKLREAEQQFNEANDVPSDVHFDDLVRIKYEVSVSTLRKLDVNGTAYRAFAHAMTTKPATPLLDID